MVGFFGNILGNDSPAEGTGFCRNLKTTLEVDLFNRSLICSEVPESEVAATILALV